MCAQPPPIAQVLEKKRKLLKSETEPPMPDSWQKTIRRMWTQ